MAVSCVRRVSRRRPMFYSVTLPKSPGSAAHARDLLGRLGDELPTKLLDDARLLISELVANAVEHVAEEGEIGVSIALDDGVLRVEVRDTGPGVEFVERDGADGDGQQYEQAIDTIERDYYRKVDRKELLNKSLGAAVESLQDQFSHYFSPKDYTQFELDTEGQFEGVGMAVTEVKQGLRVMEVYDRSPAKSGGLKKGDLIVSVNGKPLAGKTSDQATALIKGPAGSTVTLGVKSGDKTKTLKLKR